MSYYDYEYSKEICVDDPPFYGLIMAAMRRADTDNAERLKEAFLEVWEELVRRYNSPGGRLPEEAGEEFR